MAALLLCAGAAWGQQPATPAAPPPEEFHEPAGPWPGAEGDKPCCAEPGAAVGELFTADLEYSLWFVKSAHDSTALAATDIVGAADEKVLESLGNAEQQSNKPGSGARIAFGYWEIQDNPWIPGGIRDLGVETAFFFIGQRSVSQMLDDTNPTILRPFFDLNNRAESGFIVAAPGLATGGVSTTAKMNLWGAEANLWKNVYFDYPGTVYVVNVMAGLRFLDLDERLDIGSVSTFNPNLAAFPTYLAMAGDRLQASDSFATHNHFYGAQVGAAFKWWLWQSVIFEGDAKVAVGETTEDLEIAGQQVLTPAHSASIVSPGGLLALPSNMGHFHSDKFTQVPELDLKVSAPITNHLTLSTSFSALYWSRVLRPGQQIERDLDITEIPNFPPGAAATPTGLGQPGVPFQQASLWVLGINFGLEIKY